MTTKNNNQILLSSSAAESLRIIRELPTDTSLDIPAPFQQHPLITFSAIKGMDGFFCSFHVSGISSYRGLILDNIVILYDLQLNGAYFTLEKHGDAGNCYYQSVMMPGYYFSDKFKLLLSSFFNSINCSLQNRT